MSPRISVSTEMMTKIKPMSFSKALTTRRPTKRCNLSADSSTSAHTPMVTHSAPFHSSSRTVARAEGPAKAGMASGTMSGSPVYSAAAVSDGGKSCAAQSKTAPALRQ